MKKSGIFLQKGLFLVYICSEIRFPGYRDSEISESRNQIATGVKGDPINQKIYRGPRRRSSTTPMMNPIVECSALAANSASKPPLIFAPEYHDRILTHEGQLDNLRQYIEDNPRRLAIKRANPDLFRLHQNLSFAGLDFSGLGNLFLLDYPLKQVLQCSRTLTQEQIDSLKQQCLIKADCGTVFISAGVSEGEKQICRALRESGYPLIILLKDGFPAPDDPNSKYFKPKGVYFEACAEGRLLLLEPKPEAFERPDIIQTVNRKHPDLPHNISRYRFLALNAMADILHSYQGFCSRG